MTGMTPNPRFDRSAQKLRFWVPVALRAPAPGQPERSARLERRCYIDRRGWRSPWTGRHT